MTDKLEFIRSSIEHLRDEPHHVVEDAVTWADLEYLLRLAEAGEALWKKSGHMRGCANEQFRLCDCGHAEAAKAWRQAREG